MNIKTSKPKKDNEDADLEQAIRLSAQFAQEDNLTEEEKEKAKLAAAEEEQLMRAIQQSEQ